VSKSYYYKSFVCYIGPSGTGSHQPFGGATYSEPSGGRQTFGGGRGRGRKQHQSDSTSEHGRAQSRKRKCGICGEEGKYNDVLK